MKVLLINDDGIGASGLLALQRALSEAGHEVCTVAPAFEKSGVSQAITAAFALKATPTIMPFDQPGFAVEGTPADCACLGLSSLAPQADFVLSGVNNGPNVGYHVNYSGTVGAATEAAAMGRPALAVSLDWGLNPFKTAPADFKRAAAQRTQSDFRDAARKTVEIMESWPKFNLPPGVIVNVNFPAGPKRGWRELKWAGLSESIRPHNLSFSPDYEIGTAESRWYKRNLSPGGNSSSPGGDAYWLALGYVTLTPLRPRAACAASLESMGAV